MSLASQVSSTSAQGSNLNIQTPHSPVMLSEDILIEIFTELNYPEQGDDSWPISHFHPLFVASQTCHDWRTVLLSNPALWTRLLIEAPGFALYKRYQSDEYRRAWISLAKALPELVRMWIARSKGRPLAFTLKIPCSGDAFFCEDTMEPVKALSLASNMSIINQLCDVASRWKSIDVTVKFDWQEREKGLARLRALTAEDVPLLEQIHAFNLGYDGASGHIPDPTVHGGIHQGRSVKLIRLPVVESRWEELYVNWANLTELRFKYFSWPSGPNRHFEHSGLRETLALLRSCPKLVKCTLDTTRLASRAVGMLPRAVNLPRLRELILEGCESPPPRVLADCLSLPSLTDLRFPGVNDNGLRTLNHWLLRFGARLTTVAFGLPSELSRADAEELLELIPNVERLLLVYYPWKSDTREVCMVRNSGPMLLDALTIKRTSTEDLPQRTAVCPNLTKFELGYHYDDEFPASQLVSLIRSRGHGSSPGVGVEKLLVVRGWSMEDDRGDLQETVREAGLDKMKLDIKLAYCDREAPYAFCYL